MQARTAEGYRGARLQPASIEDLFQYRWVLLSTLSRFVPSISRRTLSHWATIGKLPVSRRGGSRWWVDMHRLRETFGAELANLLGEDPDVAG
jgi:hypothetical protein